MNMINKININLTTYYCPFLNIKYNGKCPIIRCHANINNKHNSGCIYNYMHKDEITLYDLSYVLNKDIEELKEDYEYGIENIKEFIELKKWLELIKRKEYITNNCEKTGVIKKTPGILQNKKILKRKLKIVNKYLRKYPLNIIKEVNKIDFWKLLYFRDNLENQSNFKLKNILFLEDEEAENLYKESKIYI